MRYNYGVPETVQYFLLVYNIRERNLEGHEVFDDPDAALARYSIVEQEYLGKGYEIVLVGAESIETVMVTHGAYFHSGDQTPKAGFSFSLS